MPCTLIDLVAGFSFSFRYTQGFFQLFLGGGGVGANEIGLLGEGKYLSMCKVSGKPQIPPSPGNFNFGPFIRCTLVESGTVFTQT